MFAAAAILLRLRPAFQQEVQPVVLPGESLFLIKRQLRRILRLYGLGQRVGAQLQLVLQAEIPAALRLGEEGVEDEPVFAAALLLGVRDIGLDAGLGDEAALFIKSSIIRNNAPAGFPLFTTYPSPRSSRPRSGGRAGYRPLRALWYNSTGRFNIYPARF